VTRFAETRQVIAVELQGHGRTNDLPDRPMTIENMADDIVALMNQIRIEQVDIFGYSLGGSVGLNIAMRYPEHVDKLIAVSTAYSTDGTYSEVVEGIEQITPEIFAGTPFEAEYLRLAPNPENFPMLVEKLVALDVEFQGWPAEAIEDITVPTFLIIGDGDVIRPEHAVEMFRLLGGGMPADLTGLPNARLAILPGTTHITAASRTDWLVPMVNEFLKAPVTETVPLE
jgi:pimeloyl-ACP methyl ester carboxylesterase